MQKINLKEKFEKFEDYWSPKILGELNGQHVKIAKFKGAFDWHFHEQEDEMFLVIKGSFRMEFRDKTQYLEEGEMIIVPKGVEHRPVADQEAHVMMLEPASTVNTGNLENSDKTKEAVWL